MEKHSFTRIYILKELKEQPLSGYDLIQRLGEHSGKKPSSGTVYPILTDLEETKHLTATQVGRKKIYTITTKGKKTLQLLAEQHKKVFEEHKRLIKLLSGMSTKTNQDEVKFRSVKSPAENKWLRYNMDVIGELKQSILEVIQQPFNEKKAESWRKTMVKEIAVLKQLKRK